MFYVYIIYSKYLDRYYIGQTENTQTRLLQHNNGYFSNSYTSKSNDWEIVFSATCNSRKQAVNIENFIKKMKSRKFTEKIIADDLLFVSLKEKLKD